MSREKWRNQDSDRRDWVTSRSENRYAEDEWESHFTTLQTDTMMVETMSEKDKKRNKSRL